MKPRKATVACLYNGKNATAQIAADLGSFRFTDVASGSSDSISIQVNDRDRRWINGWFPQKGDHLTPTIRTENWEHNWQWGAMFCGSFVVDDFSFRGGPLSMTLEGVAIPATSSFRTKKRTITYEGTTVKEIARKVASRAGVVLFYEAPAVSVEKVEQNNQDDCSFLNTIVTRYGLAMKVFNNKLVIFNEGAYEARPAVATLSGNEYPTYNPGRRIIKVEPGWSWNTTLEGTYTGVSYEYTNSDKNKTFTVTAGGGGRILYCNEAAENLTEATAIALAALNNANKSTTTMRVTIRGSWRIYAGACVNVTGLGQLGGKYFVEKAEHSIGSGYKMTLTLRKVERRFTSAKAYSTSVAERHSVQQQPAPPAAAPAAPPAAPPAPKKGGTYVLKVTKKGYYTAAEALAGAVKPGNPHGVRRPGTYFIFNISQGMLNLTTVKGVPGSWVNPN